MKVSAEVAQSREKNGTMFVLNAGVTHSKNAAKVDESHMMK